MPAARPTEGRCDLLAAWHVEQGTFEGVSLDGLTVALAIHIPGKMSDGNWDIMPYLPETATPAQRQALEAIFQGRAGGPMGRVAAVVSRWHEPRSVPITWERDGLRRRVHTPDVLDIEVEATPGFDGASEVWITNLKHMACRMMAAAVGRRGHYDDQGRRWDHTGRNAHYGPFEWEG